MSGVGAVGSPSVPPEARAESTKDPVAFSGLDERPHPNSGPHTAVSAVPDPKYADVPYKRRVVRHREVISNGAPTVRTVSCLDDGEGIVDHPGEDCFVEILLAFLETGRAACGEVGNAPSELFVARDMVDFAVDWMNRHL